jgi:hypothetical protein
MKAFLTKTLLFVLIALFMSVLVIMILRKTCDKEKFFKLPSDVQVLFAGHSHVRLAVNDSLIKGAKNISEEGEAYIYTYQKLKQYLAYNPQVKYVMLECTNNALSEYYDSRSWSEHFIKTKLPDYNLNLESEDFLCLFRKEPTTTLITFSISARTQLEFLTDTTMSYPAYAEWHKHRHYKNSDVDSLLLHPKKDSLDLAAMKYSEHAGTYIRKIATLCKNKGVQLILMRSPIHVRWEYRQNENMFREQIQRQFSDLPFLDFGNRAFDNKEFRDLAHLNYIGASHFSGILSGVLQNKELLHSQGYHDMSVPTDTID